MYTGTGFSVEVLLLLVKKLHKWLLHKRSHVRYLTAEKSHHHKKTRGKNTWKKHVIMKRLQAYLNKEIKCSTCRSEKVMMTKIIWMCILTTALPSSVAPKNVPKGTRKWPHVIPAKSKRGLGICVQKMVKNSLIKWPIIRSRNSKTKITHRRAQKNPEKSDFRHQLLHENFSSLHQCLEKKMEGIKLSKIRDSSVVGRSVDRLIDWLIYTNQLVIPLLMGQQSLNFHELLWFLAGKARRASHEIRWQFTNRCPKTLWKFPKNKKSAVQSKAPALKRWQAAWVKRASNRKTASRIAPPPDSPWERLVSTQGLCFVSIICWPGRDERKFWWIPTHINDSSRTFDMIFQRVTWKSGFLAWPFSGQTILKIKNRIIN